MIRAFGLLLIAACAMAAQTLEEDLNAYRDLNDFAVTQGKHIDPSVVEKILTHLESHFQEYPDAFLKAGDFYFRSGNADEAIRTYQAGMAADGARKIVYQKREIEALIRQKDLERAYQLNEEILRDHPQDPEARGLNASFLLDKGQTDAAISELQSAIQSMPGNFVAQFNLGRAYFVKGDLEHARQQFEKALELRPDYQPARQALTQLALRRGDFDSTLKYAEETLRRDPDDNVAALLKAAALEHKGSYDEARTMLDRLLKKNAENKDALLELGVLDLVQKRYAEAEGPFRIAYALDPSNLRGLLGMAQVCFEEGKPEQAVKLIADEAARQPQRSELRKELANTEVRAKQYEKAIADYQAVLETYKDAPVEQADLYNRAGITYAMTNNFEKAIESLEKATQLAPANVGYAASLAEFYDRAGRQKDAIAEYRKALKIDPTNAIAMNNLAYLLTTTGGDLDEALKLAQGARQQLPKMNEVLDTLGWIYLKRRQIAEAVDLFRELNSRVKDNPTYHHHYGMALAEQGNKAAALEELDTALQCHPDPKEEADIKALIRTLQ
jgi:tetratricopeptide (TPR) repeat protein